MVSVLLYKCCWIYAFILYFSHLTKFSHGFSVKFDVTCKTEIREMWVINLWRQSASAENNSRIFFHNSLRKRTEFKKIMYRIVMPTCFFFWGGEDIPSLKKYIYIYTLDLINMNDIFIIFINLLFFCENMILLASVLARNYPLLKYYSSNYLRRVSSGFLLSPRWLHWQSFPLLKK